jgi:methylated-DNA-[protein]-cysteine S-methyltransferase
MRQRRPTAGTGGATAHSTSDGPPADGPTADAPVTDDPTPRHPATDDHCTDDRTGDGPTTDYAVIDTPIGPLELVARGEQLVAIHMRPARRDDRDAPGPRTPDPDTAGLDDGADRRVLAVGPGQHGIADAVVRAASEQLSGYFAGERRSFAIPTRLEGTAFQRAIWSALLEVPYGRTITYGGLAARIGRPGAARAAGRAVARNPLPVVVPCHRVVGSDGSLTGFAGGLRRKALLLELEQGPVTR